MSRLDDYRAHRLAGGCGWCKNQAVVGCLCAFCHAAYQRRREKRNRKDPCRRCGKLKIGPAAKSLTCWHCRMAIFAQLDCTKIEATNQ